MNEEAQEEEDAWPFGVPRPAELELVYASAVVEPAPEFAHPASVDAAERVRQQKIDVACHGLQLCMRVVREWAAPDPLCPAAPASLLEVRDNLLAYVSSVTDTPRSDHGASRWLNAWACSWASYPFAAVDSNDAAAGEDADLAYEPAAPLPRAHHHERVGDAASVASTRSARTAPHGSAWQVRGVSAEAHPLARCVCAWLAATADALRHALVQRVADSCSTALVPAKGVLEHGMADVDECAVADTLPHLHCAWLNPMFSFLLQHYDSALGTLFTNEQQPLAASTSSALLTDYPGPWDGASVGSEAEADAEPASVFELESLVLSTTAAVLEVAYSRAMEAVRQAVAALRAAQASCSVRSAVSVSRSLAHLSSLLQRELVSACGTQHRHTANALLPAHVLRAYGLPGSVGDVVQHGLEMAANSHSAQLAHAAATLFTAHAASVPTPCPPA
ncbi:MAG: hypothetical protein EOO41_04060, partial [Methanobacteriota archaeon]